MIRCSDPKLECLLEVEYRCTPVESNICENRDFKEKATVTHFKTEPQPGMVFRLSRETMCSEPEPDETSSPCTTSWEFVETRNCTQEEVAKQVEFERQAKCHEISTEIERAAKLKGKIESDEVYECIQKDAIKSSELSNDLVFLAIVLQSKDLKIQEIALRKFEKFNWDQSSSDHFRAFYTIFKDEYASPAKKRSKLPQKISGKVNALWKRTQAKFKEIQK